MIKVQDHYSDNSDWVDPETYVPEKQFIEYVGWLVQEDDNQVTLAQGRSIQNKKWTYDNLMHLMKKNIIKRKYIKIQ